MRNIRLSAPLKRALKFLPGRGVAIVALFTIIYVTFHRLIEEWVTKNVVINIASQVESIWYNDIFFFAISAVIVTSTAHRFKKYTPSFNLIILLTLFTIGYVYYRFISCIFTFTPLASVSIFKYSDLIVLAVTCNWLLLVKRQKKLPANNSESFLDDEPLGQDKSDELGYNEYAKRLSTKILQSHFHKSFAIGINGKWGVGKTSFIDLMKRNLAGNEFLEVNFNPWNSSTSKAIIQDFFETVQQVIRPHHSTLSSLLVRYSHKLMAINDGLFSKSINATVTFATGIESIQSLYNDINYSLKKIGLKIIVFIDDMDRLDKDEIVEVIRLMRNTANFYNTIFIVAYDKNYVTSALEQHNPYNHQKFLEKIFQIEVTLPHFKKDIFRHKLAEKLKYSFPSQFHPRIEYEILGTVSVTPAYLNDWLETMRDVTRLANSLLLNLSKLIGEVEFIDFLRLELLRLKYPSVYELLFKRTDDFLETAKSNNEEFTYQLRSKKNESNNLNSALKHETFLSYYLTNYHNDLGVANKDIDKIIELVQNIFSSGRSFGPSRSHLSVVHPSKFNRYFAYNLLEGNLSEVEFSKARSLTQEGFNSLITNWVQQGFEYELQDRFSRIKSFDTREDFEKVIKAIFHLANQPTKSPNYVTRDLVGYEGKDLLSKLNNYDDRIQLKFYPGTEERKRYQSFLRSLFNDAKSPFIFEAEIASLILNDFSDNFGLPKDEFEKILISYFKQYCLQHPTLDNNTWRLYHSCHKTNRQELGGGSFRREEETLQEAKAIMQQTILNNFDSFLLAIIDTEVFKQKSFAVSNFVVQLYGSWGAFKALIDEMREEEWKYLNEFKELFQKFEKANFSVYVPFDFKTIPIHLRKNEYA